METKPSNPKDLIGSTKPGISAIPLSPLYMLGAAMLEGTKYGRHNYRVVGVRASVYFDAAFRHMSDYWEGEDIDTVSGIPHLAKAMACLTIILDAEENEKLTDDRPPRTKAGWMKRAQTRTTKVLSNIKGKVLPPYTQAKINFDDDVDLVELETSKVQGFKIGDRVRVNETCAIPRFHGHKGSVIGVDNDFFSVKFDDPVSDKIRHFLGTSLNLLI